MFDQSHGNTPIKYVGIDVEIQKKKVRFMIDTGATINLIKKQTINQLGEYIPICLYASTITLILTAVIFIIF